MKANSLTQRSLPIVVGDFEAEQPKPFRFAVIRLVNHPVLIGVVLGIAGGKGIGEWFLPAKGVGIGGDDGSSRGGVPHEELRLRAFDWNRVGVKSRFCASLGRM